MLIAQCCMDNVVPHVIPFAEHIGHADWRFRDAAVMSFGCIVDGPDPKTLNQHTWNLIPHLINMLKTDNSLAVRDTCAWTLGRICERLPQTILQHPSVNDLVAALLLSLENDPRVATNACWAFSSLAEVGCPHIDFYFFHNMREVKSSRSNMLDLKPDISYLFLG